LSTQGPERLFFLPDFFNPVKNGTGVQNQDKQSTTAVALNLTSIERKQNAYQYKNNLNYSLLLCRKSVSMKRL
jgi:hypothetical protein